MRTLRMCLQSRTRAFFHLVDTACCAHVWNRGMHLICKCVNSICTCAHTYSCIRPAGLDGGRAVVQKEGGPEVACPRHVGLFDPGSAPSGARGRGVRGLDDQAKGRRCARAKSPRNECGLNFIRFARGPGRTYAVGRMHPRRPSGRVRSHSAQPAQTTTASPPPTSSVRGSGWQM